MDVTQVWKHRDHNTKYTGEIHEQQHEESGKTNTNNIHMWQIISKNRFLIKWYKIYDAQIDNIERASTRVVRIVYYDDSMLHTIYLYSMWCYQ